ncbi:MAG: hypothetical protein IJG82_09320 [Atopobiaceae bacterium]|nr:hypothetical protein [Atopobiaceae bacterium]
MSADLWDEIQTKTRQLDACIRELRKSGTAFAEAERTYKVKLREVCLRLRADGMAIGMIDKTCYGHPEVADLRFQRDIAETVYKANIEAINSIKLQLRIVDAQLGREWGASQ